MTDLRKLLIEARTWIVANEKHESVCPTRVMGTWGRCRCGFVSIIGRIDAALAEKVEPVAWMWLEGTELMNGTDVEQFERVEFSREKPDEDAYGLTPLYTAPLSGVRAGMLRAAGICKEWEAKLSQGAGYAIRTAREAITRAADQVNAEGCTRSHPHDDMNAECERKTTIARETNSRANAMQAIKEDAPVMKAWNNYKSSDEFKNTRKWALHEEHVDGSLWAAFYAGFFACAVDQINAEGQRIGGLEQSGSHESRRADNTDGLPESPVVVAPSAPHSANQPDTVAVPREQLEHWAEYWNRNVNEKSMTDALEHILDEIDAVLQAAQEAK